MNTLTNNNLMVISPKPRKKSLFLIQEKIAKERRSGKNVVLIGLCGGQSSGKTKIAQYYQKNIPNSKVISEKGYFKNRTRKLSANEPFIEDFDGYSKERKTLLIELSKPDSYDHEALIETLTNLVKGEKVTVPTYDDNTDSVIPDDVEIDPKKINIVILEGSFIFYNQTIREMLDVKLFSEVDDDVRLSRLILKENKYLNSNPKAIKIFSIIYTKFLKPSYENYVESCKIYAQFNLPNYVINVEGEIMEDNLI